MPGSEQDDIHRLISSRETPEPGVGCGTADQAAWAGEEAGPPISRVAPTTTATPNADPTAIRRTGGRAGGRRAGTSSVARATSIARVASLRSAGRVDDIVVLMTAP